MTGQMYADKPASLEGANLLLTGGEPSSDMARILNGMVPVKSTKLDLLLEPAVVFSGHYDGGRFHLENHAVGSAAYDARANSVVVGGASSSNICDKVYQPMTQSTLLGLIEAELETIRDATGRKARAFVVDNASGTVYEAVPEERAMYALPEREKTLPE